MTSDGEIRIYIHLSTFVYITKFLLNKREITTKFVQKEAWKEEAAL